MLSQAHAVIGAYSTTWFEPILDLPEGLNEAASCAYLCMRAIDEIEDHPRLDTATKASVLRQVGQVLQTRFGDADFRRVFHANGALPELPEVTLRLGEWARLAPEDIAPRILETFAAMSERMASWAETCWAISTKADLDRYTYAVAGTLVLLLSDLWAWYDGTRSNRTHGVAYGRALQAVNILVDRDEDTARAVDFWPDRWTSREMVTYAKAELAVADKYLAGLPAGPARSFCAGPLRDAHAAVEKDRHGNAGS